jgi:hypothetical protein
LFLGTLIVRQGIDLLEDVAVSVRDWVNGKGRIERALQVIHGLLFGKMVLATYRIGIRAVNPEREPSVKECHEKDDSSYNTNENEVHLAQGL